MARGEAMLELLHSSLRWNGASYPDIVFDLKSAISL